MMSAKAASFAEWKQKLRQLPEHPFWRAVVAWVKKHPREVTVLGCMIATLAAPFMLRPAGATGPGRYDKRLVVMTPHHEIIRREFAQGFARHWKAETGQTVFVDWRVPGGTSEIAMMLRSEYLGAFQQFWRRSGKEWSQEVAAACLEPAVSLESVKESDMTPGQRARKAFLESEVGIGVDLFFGGGPYDFQKQSKAGTLVASSKGGKDGLPALREKHPQWFSDDGVPETLSGETFRDRDERWVGTCLSSFGIVFNRDVLRRLGVRKDPEQWEDLADPRLMGQIALSDPSKSGSVTKAFEMVIQQQMHQALASLEQENGKWAEASVEARRKEAVRRGWSSGMRLIQRIAANSRYFTDASPKIPLEVLRGDAAAGMCIDYYGRSAQEQVKQKDGSSRVGFVTPLGGTAISVDPIGMLRGAPEPELATAFMEYVLSDGGQKLWGFRAGEPGGPKSVALRRLPVRRDFYTEEHLPAMSDADEEPYERAKSFFYEADWTGPVFNSVRFIIRIACVDTHNELRHAWKELVKADFPPEATRAFHEMGMIHYDNAAGEISRAVSGKDKSAEVRLARTLGNSFRQQYDLAVRLARRGQ